MKNIRRWGGRVLAVAAVVALVGCGGGGDDPPAAVSAEGIWTGNLSGGGAANALLLVVLNDGTYYGVYGDAQASYGLVQGTATTAGNQLTSTNGRDYAFGAGVPYAFSLNATVAPRSTLSGTVTYGPPSQATVSYALSFDGSYNTAATLADVAGTYSGAVGSLLGISNLTLNIDAAGSLTGVTSTGCQVSGLLSPRGATAVYNLSVNLDAVTCGQAISGQGIAGLTGPNRKTLTFAAVAGDRSNAVFGGATKP